MADSCEHGIEPSGLIICRSVLNSWNYWLLKKTSCVWTELDLCKDDPKYMPFDLCKDDPQYMTFDLCKDDPQYMTFDLCTDDP